MSKLYKSIKSRNFTIKAIKNAFSNKNLVLHSGILLFNMSVAIVHFRTSDRKAVLSVWEQSVAATHDFLHTDDFERIRAFLHEYNFSNLQMYCLMEDEAVIGFLGVANKKIEMLFLLPVYIGKGWGRLMVNFAISNLQAYTVDVNEQNLSAVAFYKKLGFEVYERTLVDDQGKGYPLLRMKLKIT